MDAVRTSVVGEVKIDNVDSASVAIIGDNAITHLTTWAIAVLRTVPNSPGWRDYDFADYPMFREPIPHLLPTQLPRMRFYNEGSSIRVGAVKIVGMSTATQFQAGSTLIVDCDSRRKEFREVIFQATAAPATPKTAY